MSWTTRRRPGVMTPCPGRPGPHSTTMSLPCNHALMTHCAAIGSCKHATRNWKLNTRSSTGTAPRSSARPIIMKRCSTRPVRSGRLRAEAKHYRKLARKFLVLQEKVDRLLELLDETDITPGKTVSVAALCHHVAKLQAELKKYRVQYSCFSRALFGRRSE